MHIHTSGQAVSGGDVRAVCYCVHSLFAVMYEPAMAIVCAVTSTGLSTSSS